MITVKFSKFKLDEGRFKKVLADEVIKRMNKAGRQALMLTNHRVPVWTGESRGSLASIANALGAPDVAADILASAAAGSTREKRKNRYGEYKTFISGLVESEPLHRGSGNVITFKFRSRADGLRVGDKRAISNSPTSPWGFSRKFTRLWKTLTMAEIKLDPSLPIRKFSTIHRVTNV